MLLPSLLVVNVMWFMWLILDTVSMIAVVQQVHSDKLDITVPDSQKADLVT
ncbi:BnaC01g30530D [Brassica napus]|uniref:BnaC01g30530D protein n=2 Tax=Brassica napus TaxID=3708 RepID=A0A078I7G0_BRANA|nr:BnaC01g30530D [Brassica napus]